VAIHEKVVYTLREMTDYFPISTFEQMLVLESAITANPLFAKRLISYCIDLRGREKSGSSMNLLLKTLFSNSFLNEFNVDTKAGKSSFIKTAFGVNVIQGNLKKIVKW
jgi:hypothetical protein